MSHADDITLARLADGDPDPSLDVVRAHVSTCATCRDREAGLRRLQQELAAPLPLRSVVADVERRLAPTSTWWRLPAVGTALAAAAAVVVVVMGPPGAGGDGFTPRGGGDGTGLLIVADGAVVDDGAALGAGEALRADLLTPTAGERHLVVAIDDGGRVFWLRPAFVDAAAPPACPAPVRTDAPRVVGDETVALPLAPGSLEVRLYAVRAGDTCDVVTIDAALEAGVAPTALRLVQRRSLRVEP